MFDLQPISARIDSAELQTIKKSFLAKDLENAEQFEQRQFSRTNPQVVFSSARQSSLSEGTLVGLKYPLELDGNGGLALSSNATRVREQILEVLDTRVGERVYQPFFGVPELIFETVDENSLAQTIKTKIQDSVPIPIELNVAVELDEAGSARLNIAYSVEGSEAAFIQYSFSP